MLVKVLPRRGGSTRASARKLMAYLLGPGDHRGGEGFEAGELGNQHTEPTVVASWDPTRTASWDAHCTGVDWGDPGTAWARLHTLAQGIGDEAAAGVRLEDTAQPRNAVWHTVMAAHPEDGQLTDAQWRAIAARLMHLTKLHETGSGNPVRWVAVRHGPNAAGADHIHVMAVLVRLDGTRASIHNDVFAAQAAARWAETEFHLVPGRGRTAPDEPGQAVRADRASARSDMAATNRAGPPYPRPADMTQPTWERVQQEGRDRMWTRQGRARAAVLSAAARAISGEHLVALVQEQGLTEQQCRHPDTATRPHRDPAEIGAALAHRGWGLDFDTQVDLPTGVAWSGSLTHHGQPVAAVADHGDGDPPALYFPPGSAAQQTWDADLHATGATPAQALTGLDHHAIHGPAAADALAAAGTIVAEPPGVPHGLHR